MQQIISVDTAQPFYALTFDDGPDPELTPRLLALLRDYGARATFFVIGERALRHPDILRRILGEGHEIGNHSYSHPYMLKLTTSEFLLQVDRAQQMIADLCGVLPRLFRAPHGRMTRQQRAMMAYNRSVRMTYWSADSKDWRDHDREMISAKILEETGQGSIVLAHDSIAETIDSYAAVLPVLRDRGLTSLPVSELMTRGEVRYVPD